MYLSILTVLGFVMNWELDEYKHRPTRVVIKELSEFVIERIKDTQLLQVASSLTLTTVLSIVPIIAVMLVSFAVFPAFAESRAHLEAFIFSTLLPDGYRDQVINYLRTFSTHASGLTTFGLIGLLVTSILLINTVDETLNRIFHVRQMRPVMQRVLIYWALLTVGPMVVAGSLTLTNVLTVDNAIQGMMPGWCAIALQILMQTVGYAALYVYVPNCVVSWRHALIGGGAVAVAGIAVKWGFSLYLSSGPLTSIYGAFTAVPVVLLWIYLTWILVLAGAAIAATIPMLMSGRFADTHRTGNDFLTGIALLYTLMIEQEKGRTAVPIRELCNAVDSYPEAAGAILEKLSYIGYVGRIKDDRRDEELWGLLVSPQQTTLAPAVDALLIDGNNSLIAKENAPLHDWYALVNEAEWKKRPMAEILRFVHPVN